MVRQLGDNQIAGILLETTDGRKLALRRVARPKLEQARILAALKLSIPERLAPDREMHRAERARHKIGESWEG